MPPRLHDHRLDHVGPGAGYHPCPQLLVSVERQHRLRAPASWREQPAFFPEDLFILSALAWLLSFTAWPERGRAGVVQIATAGYIALVAVSLAHALAGRAPLDLTGPIAVLFWISAALVIAAAAAAVGGLLRAPRQPSP